MSEVQKLEKSFWGFEYKNIIARWSMAALWSDGYETFGWKLEKSEPAIEKHIWGPLRLMMAPLAIFPGSPFAKMVLDHKSENKVELKFKRDRAILNKSELNQLQSRFEFSALEIDKLEKSKRINSTAVAYLVGLIGTVFMATSVFSYLESMIPLSILMAIPGFAGWFLSYFIRKAVKGRTTKKVTPLIENQYDIIYETCKKANTLIHAEKH
ncbi:hypothetical protein [Paenibacillus donghaensis]|uniref:Uncharacterized protein n=1 Tax=Paenibacillus donghaensis TaxID=414771 RepID=A0A2Z2KCV0_9BACL|nr:hypothetical protein [Paenibacillus donghaensis]ASA23467.1 hypothetical protein B9T62_23260 [Paenibacillus donghaensis]